MAIQTKTNLKALFEDGDVPGGTDFGNMIDSSVNLAETALQTMNGPLYTTEIISPRVSAATVNVTGVLTAGSLTISTVSAPTVSTSALHATTIDASIVSAATATISTGSISSLTATNATITSASITTLNVSTASAAVFNAASANISVLQANRMGGNITTITGVGNVQAGAAQLTPDTSLLSVTSANNSYVLLGGYPGVRQYLFNPSAVSALVYPVVGGTIRGLAANAAYSLPPEGALMVMHQTSAAYIPWRSV